MMEQEHRTIPKDDIDNPMPIEQNGKLEGIPRKIYQTHKKFEKLPKGMQQALQRTEKMHPHCEYAFYDNERCDQLIADHFPKRVVDAYNALVPGAYKADLFRYCLLYRYGGLYLDAGMFCLHSLEEVVWPIGEKNYPFVSAVDQNQSGGAYNAFIASAPKHPILAVAINICVHRIERREYGRSTLHPTGPYVLGDAINLYLHHSPGTSIQAGVQGEEKDVYLLARGLRYKCRYSHFGHKISESTIVLLYRGKEYADSKYPGFYVEWRDHRKKTYYHGLWQKKQIYHL